jgi:hypothetical protein
VLRACNKLLLVTVATAFAKVFAHATSGLWVAKYGTVSSAPSLEGQKDGVSSMNNTFSILVAATLLVATTTAEAAHGPAAVNRNAVIAPVPQISTAPPQTNPIGDLNQNFDPLAVSGQINPVTGQAFGALPGQPGSPNYDPNAALPSGNNAGSALGPAGSSNLTPSGGATSSP